MVSMKDIARELNLSRCTVSNILNNKLDRYSYRQETIDMVRAKAEEMGYVVNNLAQYDCFSYSRYIQYILYKNNKRNREADI